MSEQMTDWRVDLGNVEGYAHSFVVRAASECEAVWMALEAALEDAARLPIHYRSRNYAGRYLGDGSWA